MRFALNNKGYNINERLYYTVIIYIDLPFLLTILVKFAGYKIFAVVAHET